MISRILLFFSLLLSFDRLATAAGLQTVFGANGLSKIIYNGSTLMDTSSNGGDAFTIWEYRLIARDGSIQGGWGEINSGKSWNALTNTLTWAYPWGTVQAKYLQSGDILNVQVVVTNTDPALTVEGLNIYPFYLHFPQLPSGFVDPNYPQIQFNTDGPGITSADYGSGMVVMANEDASKSLYTGFSSTGSFSYHALIGSTYNSGQATFWPKLTRPIPPGSSDTYRVSFRFAPSGTPVNSVAGDVFNGYRTTWPYLVNWTDRRPIGAIFLSTSGNGDDHHKAGFPTNPRRYFNDASVNVTSSAGLTAFQQRVLAAADYDVSAVRGMGGQGMITWDIEGQEYPQETSYVCDPEKLAQLAPEMESILPDGSKLVDTYFKKFKDAGLKTGVCIRPQSFTTYPDGTADQVYLDASLSNNQQIINAVASNLIHKIGYARNRWGVNIIYVDSAVNVNRGPLEAAVFRTVLQAFPDMLIIPEEHTAGHEAYSASWKQPGARPAEVRTSDDYKLVYPQAFSTVYVADAPVGTDGNLAQYDQYVQGVKGGDILMFRAFFQDTYYDGQVSKIYASAGLSGPPSPPAILSFSGSPSSINSGASSILSWNVNGATSLSISPSVGSVTGSSITVSPNATTTYTLTATGPGGSVQSSTTVTVITTPPSILSFSGTPSSINAGASSILSWSTTGATSLSISPSVGNVTGSSVTVSPTATTTYTLTATGAGGSVQASTKITVVTPTPSIISFSGTPSSINAGASSILSWNTTGATSLSISPSVGAVTGSSIAVTPTTTTTYTLTATNSAGAVQASTVITVVVPPPVITAFSASPASINAGGSTLLAWSVNNATSLAISPSIGGVTGSSIAVSPSSTTTYTLTATGPGGSVQSSTTVTVVTPTPSIISFSGTPSSINAGASSILSWNTTGATSLSVSPSVGNVTGSSVTVSPTATTTYTLTATGPGGSVQASTKITVATPSPSIISFSASPSSINAGASSILSWNTTGATSLSISPSIGAVTGSSIAVTPTTTTTYTLTATNSAGTAQASTVITVVIPPPAITAFSASPASINAGASTLLAWNVNGATSLSISPLVGSVTGSSITVSPNATTTYTLTATGPGGSVQSTTTVTVVVPQRAPVIGSFTATPASINAGANSVLSWNVIGATSISISPAIGIVTGSSLNVSPASTTNYTLSATNASGTTLASTTVTVVIPSAIGGTSFVTSTTAHNLLNFYSGWIGMKFTVGPAGLTVSSLARYAAPNNSGTHTVKLVSLSDGADVPGGSVTISMAGSVAGRSKSAPLPSPLVLKPGTTYLLLTQEVSGGDFWYDVDGVSTTQDAIVTSSVYGDGSGNWNYSTSGSYSFGPVSFNYTVAPLVIVSPQSGTSFVTSITPRILRNDYTGWIGTSFTTGPLGMNVTGLGRYLSPGNSRTHAVKLVRASDGADLPGGSVALSMAGGSSSQFVVAQLPSPVLLQPNTTYYVLSQEVNGGDRWYDQDSISTTTDATVNGSEYGDGGGSWNTARGGAQAFGPVTFTYTVPGR